MLTKADIKWLSKLSASKKVKIIPYNPEIKEVFRKQKEEILEILGHKVEILHKGATSFGISGQGEIDLFIPVSLDLLDEYIEKLQKVYGKPKSLSPKNRARFNHQQDNIEIEILVVNEDSEGWKRNIAFEDYLKNHSETLEEYRKLKENSKGLNIREY